MAFLDPRTTEKVVSSYQPLPNDTYRVMVTKGEAKDSQTGGRYLNLTFEVIDGEYQGRKVFHKFMTKSNSEFAMKKGASDLAALALVLGHPQAFNTEAEYLRFVKDKVCRVKLGQKKDKQSGEMQNVINDYLPDGDGDDIPSPSSDDDFSW